MLGLGLGLPRQSMTSVVAENTEFVRFTVPQSKYVYFGKCISGQIGVLYDIDLTAQHNMIYFGRCITGSRSLTDAIHSN